MTTQTKDSIFRASIGETVKAWRIARGLQVTELANRAGTTKGYISGLEKNKTHQPNEDHLVRLATALAIPVEYLVTRRLPDAEEDFGGFAAPLQAPLRQRKRGNTKREEVPSTTIPYSTASNEETQLRLILDKLAELQTLIQEFIAQREKEQ